MSTNEYKTSIRLSEKDYFEIKEISKTRGESMSTFFRRALKRELARYITPSNKEMKAIGLPERGAH
jgi:hypothetical protein